tara:strand:- start:870 stop:1448 length:579 start_codon:yes stop_codon:yes gene_type:complete
MKATEIINKVKEVIGIELSEEPIEVKLAQAELENGTIIESESFKEGDEIFIVTEDEKVPLPTGEYKLIDGEILIIEEEGIIKSLGKAEVEEEVEAEDEKEYATKEELEEVKKVVEEIKAILEPKEEEEMSNETSVKSEEVIKKVVYSSKEKMSEVEKVNHNPEAEAVPNLNLHGQNRIATTLDRVMAKIAKK